LSPNTRDVGLLLDHRGPVLWIATFVCVRRPEQFQRPLDDLLDAPEPLHFAHPSRAWSRSQAVRPTQWSSAVQHGCNDRSSETATLRTGTGVYQQAVPGLSVWPPHALLSSLSRSSSTIPSFAVWPSAVRQSRARPHLIFLHCPVHHTTAQHRTAQRTLAFHSLSFPSRESLYCCPI
jgi:hypothetical protein